MIQSNYHCNLAYAMQEAAKGNFTQLMQELSRCGLELASSSLQRELKPEHDDSPYSGYNDGKTINATGLFLITLTIRGKV